MSRKEPESLLGQGLVLRMPPGERAGVSQSSVPGDCLDLKTMTQAGPCLPGGGDPKKEILSPSHEKLTMLWL